MSRIIRVFPRRIKAATPSDELCRFDGPGWFDEADEIHISVSFSWDLPLAERLASEWKHVAPVKIGGPATGMRGEDFTPGMYLRQGYVITSRGCPECCRFCLAWRRDGSTARELPVADGWNVQDDNLLACSETHIRSVCDMLKRQKHRAVFSGGIQAARLRPWHIDVFSQLKQRPIIWLAYDDPADLDAVSHAISMLTSAGWSRQTLRVYVLCGFHHDTMPEAEARLRAILCMGADPLAMVFREGLKQEDIAWHKWARQWIRPAIMHRKTNV